MKYTENYIKDKIKLINSIFNSILSLALKLHWFYYSRIWPIIIAIAILLLLDNVIFWF